MGIGRIGLCGCTFCLCYRRFPSRPWTLFPSSCCTGAPHGGVLDVLREEWEETGGGPVSLPARPPPQSMYVTALQEKMRATAALAKEAWVAAQVGQKCRYDAQVQL